MNLVDHKVKKNNVPMLSLSDIETIANDVLRNFQLTEESCKSGINVERLAEKYLGLRIDYTHLSNNGSILGMIIFQDCAVPLYIPEEQTVKFFEAKAGTVMIDQALVSTPKQGRARFTIAHECAHWILHRPTQYTYLNQIALNIQPTVIKDDVAIVCRKANSKQNTSRDWKEWQADNLASALLMPAGAVRQFVHDFTQKLSDGPSLSFELYGEKYVQAKTASLIRQMAAIFQVSEKAAEIRLNRLGILDQRNEHLNQMALETLIDPMHPLF